MPEIGQYGNRPCERLLMLGITTGTSGQPKLNPVTRTWLREYRRSWERRPASRQLEQIVDRTGTLYPKNYWPLSLIACWLEGTIGYQSRQLPRYYGSTPTRDLGLVSTEGRHTIPLHVGRPEGVLAVDGNYYEFVPAEAMASADPPVLECHELTPGHEYFLLMTTSSGFYRYDIGDVVRCQGYIGEAPVLEIHECRNPAKGRLANPALRRPHQAPQRP